MERTVKLVQQMKLAEIVKKKVAAYARVSTGKDTMLQSLSAQISYYSDMIQKNTEWEFVSVYADEDCTGTKENRPEFMRMIADCKQGKIDMIITKSISRFARNTVTLLTTVRELKSMGVAVYFEEQKIDTLTADGELMLTILASYAQEESLSVSENCKWRIRDKFAEGQSTPFNVYGYRLVDGEVQIVPEEVELVRWIFRTYLQGYGKQAIVNMLNAAGVPGRIGGEWAAFTIYSMLRNEKFAGDLLLQKSYIEDHLTKKHRKNRGEMPKYFIADNHEAIIDRQTYYQVQEEIRKRAKYYASPAGETNELTSKIRCGLCGKSYRRCTTAVRKKWSCATYITKGKKSCPSNSIPETTLKEACALALGLPEYDAESVQFRIEYIEALPEHTLRFYFRDGSVREQVWDWPARGDGWTQEMRDKAAERARVQNAKRSRKAQSTSNSSGTESTASSSGYGSGATAEGSGLCQSFNRPA